MPRVFMHIPDVFACGHYRAFLPVLNCHESLVKKNIYLTMGEDLHSDEEHFDAYIFHRVPLDSLSFFVDTIKKNKKRVCWQLDDDIMHIPDWMPNTESIVNKWSLNKCLELSDKIWVSTERLKEQVGKPDPILPSKTIVLPNLIDTNAFPSFPVPNNDPIRILWTGSPSHDKDLQILVKPIEELLAEYGSKIQFLFWGWIPDAFVEYYRPLSEIHTLGEMRALVKQKQKYGTNLLYLEGMPFRVYYDKLCHIRASIGLCPLYDCVFNESKSNLKYLEYSAANIATIATNMKPYQCISDGKDGLLVQPGDENGWYNKIKSLIDDRELRDYLASNARGKVISEYSWQSENRYLWSKAFEELGV